MRDLPFDIASLHSAYESGISAQAIIAECYRRIAAVNDPGIFIHLISKQELLAEAQALGSFDAQAKPLWGIPFVIKDNIDAAGKPTTAACPDYAYVAEEDAFVVSALRQAGALLIGKTNLDQFATGLVGVRTPYPAPRNAIDPLVVPGGSSGGSAVAVAHGIVSFSLGTDTAGSGRVPAALNNIVGLKPTLGALSASGVVPACRTLDTVSIFALDVEDAWQVFQVACAYDAADSFSRPIAAPGLASLPQKFSVGVPSKESIRFFGDDIQAQSFSAALRSIEDLGGRIVEIDFEPFYEIAGLLYAGSWVAERYTVIEDYLKASPDTIFPVTRTIIGKAESLSAADAFRDTYRLADLKRRVAPALASVDLLCVPTIPTFCTLADLEADPIGPNNQLGTYTNFVNLLDMCGIAVPVANRADGRPGSVTILAGKGEDAKPVALASALHQQSGSKLGATSWRLPPAPSASETLESDEIAIAAVGAHMSGLPLNGDLTRLDGRFIKAARTVPDYRLYALAGGPPHRPGLMRDEGGASIELEIWALPLRNFGSFMKGIPSPLGIGTVELENGETVNGFICEASGLAGARDITPFGGWRSYLFDQTTSVRD